MIFRKGELKILWPFYLYTFLFGVSSMIIPFMIIYFRDLGFSFFQITLITGIFAVTETLMEVPTGAFADAHGRKLSVIMGFMIASFAIFLIPFMESFIFLLAAWALAGLGISFANGAEESWVIDNLNKLRRKDLHQEFFIKDMSITSFGAVFAPLIGALIVRHNPIDVLWFIFGAGFLLNSLILLLFAPELRKKPSKTTVVKSVKRMAKDTHKGLKFTLSHRKILLIITAGIFFLLMEIGEDG